MRRILRFALVFLPAFVVCLWLYPRVQPVYQKAVVAVVDVGLHRLEPPMRIEIIEHGGWATYTLHSDGTESFYWSRPGENLTLFFVGLAFLPALLIATPVSLRRRAGLLGVGLLLLYALQVVAGLGLVLSIRCLAEDPGSMVCQWGKTVGNTFGQVAAFVIWGLLTWHVWLPRAEESAEATESDPVARGRWVGSPVFATACVVATVVLGVAYSNHFMNDFHFDDAPIIIDNLSIRSLGNTGKFFTDPHTFSTRPENAVYRPLLTLSHALDWAASDSRARQFRRTQLALLLALGAALVFLFKRLCDFGLGDPLNRYGALAAALLFCVSVANAETVNDISARADLVASLGIVVCFCIYLAWPDWRRTNLFLLPMLVGALASPLTLVFAPLFVVFAWFFEEDRSLSDALLRPGWRQLGSVIGRCAPVLLAALLLFVLLRWMGAATGASVADHGWSETIQQPAAWLRHVRLFVLPVGSSSTPPVFAGLTFVVVLLVAIGWFSRVRDLRPAAFGLAWFAITSLAVGDRMFLPSVGLTLALASLAGAGLRRRHDKKMPAVRWTVAGLAIALVTMHVVATRERNRVWRDDETLWADVVRQEHDDDRGLMNYGRALAAHGRADEALEYLGRATPSPAVELELALAISASSRTADAEEPFRRALQLNSRDARGHAVFARWLTARGRGPEAVEHLVTALEISPTSADLRWSLMNLHAASGNEAALATVANATLAILATDNLARAYASGRIPLWATTETADAYASMAREELEARRWVDAAVIYRQAISLDPTATQSRANLAWSRMQLGFLEGAVDSYRNGLEIDPTSAPTWNDLGWALARLERFDAAIECFEKAVELDPTFSLARSNLAWARQQSASGAPSSP
ncbi:MAG: tetratricopeptide repeat protein [Deltaproteobacteria bacterium]|nr:tetratricopeptide repeat protein [Deltaproteobacteria bacterium]